ncbi:hypothetical protein NUSPORA_02350 [Nucleospora cyclopteri]
MLWKLSNFLYLWNINASKTYKGLMVLNDNPYNLEIEHYNSNNFSFIKNHTVFIKYKLHDRNCYQKPAYIYYNVLFFLCKSNFFLEGCPKSELEYFNIDIESVFKLMSNKELKNNFLYANHIFKIFHLLKLDINNNFDGAEIYRNSANIPQPEHFNPHEMLLEDFQRKNILLSNTCRVSVNAEIFFELLNTLNLHFIVHIPTVIKFCYESFFIKIDLYEKYSFSRYFTFFFQQNQDANIHITAVNTLKCNCLMRVVKVGKEFYYIAFVEPFLCEIDCLAEIVYFNEETKEMKQLPFTTAEQKAQISDLLKNLPTEDIEIEPVDKPITFPTLQPVPKQEPIDQFIDKFTIPDLLFSMKYIYYYVVIIFLITFLITLLGYLIYQLMKKNKMNIDVNIFPHLKKDIKPDIGK